MGASVGAIYGYGSFGETNNTLDERIVLESTPTLASGCRYERSAKNKRLPKYISGTSTQFISNVGQDFCTVAT